MDKVFYSLDYRKEMVLTVTLAIDRLFDNVYRELHAHNYLTPRNTKKYIQDEHAIRTTLELLGIKSEEMKNINSRSYYKLVTVYEWLHEND